MIEKDIEIEIIQKLKTNIIIRDLRFLLGTKFREFSIVANYRRLLKYNDNNCLKIKNSDQNYEWPISYVFPDEYQFYRCNDILEREQDFEQFLKYYLLFLQMERIACFYDFKETEDRKDLKQRYLSEEHKRILINELKNSLADYYIITNDFELKKVDLIDKVRQKIYFFIKKVLSKCFFRSGLCANKIEINSQIDPQIGLINIKK